VIAPDRFRALVPELGPASERLTIDATVAHVSAFSLAGIAAMRSG
jgi:hypothetical protein